MSLAAETSKRPTFLTIFQKLCYILKSTTYYSPLETMRLHRVVAVNKLYT